MIPIISVIMATYNGEKYIEEAIDSILNQTYDEFEFIIIDDGSTDNTSKIINTYKDKRIKYIKKESNSGIADCLNIGVSLAKGKYIARMDDDDISMNNRLQLQRLKLDNDENIIVCGSNIFTKNKYNNVRRTPEFHEEILVRMIFENPIVHPSVMIRKSILNNNPYNNLMVPSEDYDLWSRLIFKGSFYNIQEPLLFYRSHLKSQTTKRRKEQLIKNVTIFKRMLRITGFGDSLINNDSVYNFASHNYYISGEKLKNLICWFGKLKKERNKAFLKEGFDKIADDNLNRFLKSYFLNKTLFKKIIPFLFLSSKYKRIIINYYYPKYFKWQVKK